MKADLVFRALTERLASLTDAPSHEARDILEAVCHVDDRMFPMFLVSGELSEDMEHRVKDICARREAGEPLAYILQSAWFYGLQFYVTADCLIPQPDTEIVTEKLISFLRPGMRFADLCTGSGCIALSALTHAKETTAIGYDLSDGALAVSRKNGERLKLSGRFEAVKADVFAEDFLANTGEFDAIVSNPPYIPRDVIATLSAEVQREPHMALDGGEDGLIFYRRLLEICPLHIKKGGKLFLEIGYDQRIALAAICEDMGLHYEFYGDFGGNDRVLVISL